MNPKKNYFDKFVTILEYGAAILFTLLTIDILWKVIARISKIPAPYTDDIAQILIIWISMIAGAILFYHKQHLGLDILEQKVPEQYKHYLAAVIDFFNLCLGLVLVWGGAFLVAKMFEYGQVTPALRIKQGWLYLALPVSGSLITIFSARSFYLDLFKNKKGEKQA